MWATSKGGSFLGLSLAGTSHAGERWGCFATRCDEAQAFPHGVGGHWDVGCAEAPLSLGVCSWGRQPNVTRAEKPTWTLPLSAISAQGRGCSFLPGKLASPGASESCFSSIVCREALFRNWPILLRFTRVTAVLLFAASKRLVSSPPASCALVCWVLTSVSKDERALVTWSSTSSCRKRS